MMKNLFLSLLLTAGSLAQTAGKFECRTSGHSDWVDNRSVSYDANGRAHVSGDWEAPSDVIQVCTLMVGSTIYVLDGTPDAMSNCGYIPFDKPAQFRKVGKKIFVLDSRGKELEFHVAKTEEEDPGVRKARIELCQQGILKGDRCTDVPPADKK